MSDPPTDLLAVFDRLAREAGLVATATDVTRRLARAGGPDVIVTAREAGRFRALVLIAVVAPEGAVAARELLLLAAHLGAGAFALVGEHYVVRYTLPEAQLARDALVDAITYTADAAQAVRAWIDTRDRDPAIVFQHWVL